MIPRPNRPNAERIRASLALTTPNVAASTDWLDLLMHDRPGPRSGPGSYPGLHDLARAVEIANDPARASEHGAALWAIVLMAAPRHQHIFTPPEQLPFMMCGDRRRYRVDEDSPCGGTSLVAQDRALVASLSDDYYEVVKVLTEAIREGAEPSAEAHR